MWSEVIGQDDTVKSIKQVVEKRSSHAFLFTGPSGVGKTTLARICAHELGCQKPQEIDAATFTGIDDMRQITATLQYRPLDTASVKVLIVDEAHGLSKNALDALLKAIEEPPAWAYWFLCTTQGDKIIKTIKTRCTVYNLKPVSSSQLFDFLSTIANKEQLKINDQIIDLCAKEADGSPRQALTNLAVCTTATDRAQAATLLRSAADVPEAIELARALYKGLGWDQIKPILISLQDQNPESIRLMIVNYFIKVALGAADKSRQLESSAAILDAFSTPFSASDKLAPVILAVLRLYQ